MDSQNTVGVFARGQSELCYDSFIYPVGTRYDREVHGLDALGALRAVFSVTAIDPSGMDSCVSLNSAHVYWDRLIHHVDARQDREVHGSYAPGALQAVYPVYFSPIASQTRDFTRFEPCTSRLIRVRAVYLKP